MNRAPRTRLGAIVAVLAASWVSAAGATPTMTHPQLEVSTLVSGLEAPTSIAFIGSNDLLVLEKNTGRVVRVVGGVSQGPVLDLSVNSASERGLLGIALEPGFPTNPGVYLFWSCRSTTTPANEFFPEECCCLDANMTGPDTDDVLQAPILGNRVDRFVWNGSSLVYDRNLIMLRSFQNDAAPEPPGQGDEAQLPRANHDGGVIDFGPDGKLYILLGDLGRRGQLQNLPSGPTPTGLGDPVADDQFGGPRPDDRHLAGVILRLEADGTTPTDNPFFALGAQLGGEEGANIQRIFAYGIRNSFGMAFDPKSGQLWMEENGEDAFDELNRVEPGMNSGWIQVIGPLSRLNEYKEIETTSLHHEDFPNLQQFRWGPERIADSEAEAQARLFVLEGSTYSDPEFSWKHVLAPAAIGFVEGDGLGPSFANDLIVGMSVPEPLGGPLFHFNLTGNRERIGVDDPRLEDRVADNATFHDMTESESLLIGRDFGVVTDIETGPNGHLFVASLIDGAIYEIARKSRRGTEAHLSQSTPNVQLSLTSSKRSDGTNLVAYDLPERGRVNLAVFDVLGQRVALLANGLQEAGSQQVSWDPRHPKKIARGVYWLRLRVDGEDSGSRLEQTRKVVVDR